MDKKAKPSMAGAPGRMSLLRFPVRVIIAITGPWTWENARGWLIFIVLLLIARWAWFEPFKIPSVSMEPTLHGDPRYFRGDRVFVNKYIYGLRVPFTNKRLFRGREPQRWEIVVFKSVESPPPAGLWTRLRRVVFPKHVIKRVVGLPGERVHIADGHVYINGERLDPPEELRPVLYYTTGLEVSDADVRAFLIALAQEESREIIALWQGPTDTRLNDLCAYLDKLQQRLAPLNSTVITDETAKDLVADISPSVWETAKEAASVEQNNRRHPLRYGILPQDEFSVVPKDCYFVLGDNSPRSADGRIWGWLPNSHIVGRAFCIFLPVSRWRDFTGFTRTWVGLLGLFIIPGLIVSYELLRGFVVVSWRVRDDALPGVLAKGEHVLVNRLGLRKPFLCKTTLQRGDVVLCHAPADSPFARALFIGCVAGLPGETVCVNKDRVYVEGQETAGGVRSPEKAKNSQGHKPRRAAWMCEKQPTVPADHYLILADGVAGELDSRVVGWISLHDVIGRVSLVWWPIRRRRRIPARRTPNPGNET